MRKIETIEQLARLSPEVISQMPVEDLLGKDIAKDLNLKESERGSRSDLLKDLLMPGLKDTLKTAAGFGGGLLSVTSSLPGEEPNVFRSTAGGALSGFASGGPLGALLGGVGGYVSGSQQLEGHLINKDNMRKQNIISKTTSPTIFKDGGIVEKTEVQTEDGEVLFLPDSLELAKVFASKKHSEMKDDKITDLLKPGTVVFSKDKTFDPKSISDNLIGQGSSYYSEDETLFNDPVEVGNVFGTKKISFADAALKLKNKIRIVEDTNDIFDDITNTENKVFRMAFVKELMNKQKTGKGIPVQEDEVPQFKLGGVIPGIDNFMKTLSALNPNQEFNQDQFETFLYPDLGTYDRQTFKTLEDARNQANIDKGTNNSIYNGAMFNYAGGTYSTDPLEDETEKAGFQFATGIKKQQDQTYPNLDAKQPEEVNKAFETLYNRLPELKKQSDEAYKQGLADLDTLAKKNKRNMGLSAIAGTLGNFLQDPTKEPLIKDNAFIDQMFRSTPISVIESQASALSGQTQGLAQAMIQAGVDPKDIPSLLAGSQTRTLAAETKLRLGAIKERRADERNKYAALRQNRIDNLRSVLAAEDETKSNKNTQLMKGTENLQDYLSGLRDLETDRMKEESRIRENKFNNDQTLFQNEFDIKGTEADLNIQERQVKVNEDRNERDRQEILRKEAERKRQAELAGVDLPDISTDTPDVDEQEIIDVGGDVIETQEPIQEELQQNELGPLSPIPEEASDSMIREDGDGRPYTQIGDERLYLDGDGNLVPEVPQKPSEPINIKQDLQGNSSTTVGGQLLSLNDYKQPGGGFKILSLKKNVEEDRDTRLTSPLRDRNIFIQDDHGNNIEIPLTSIVDITTRKPITEVSQLKPGQPILVENESGDLVEIPAEKVIMDRGEVQINTIETKKPNTLDNESDVVDAPRVSQELKDDVFVEESIAASNRISSEVVSALKVSNKEAEKSNLLDPSMSNRELLQSLKRNTGDSKVVRHLKKYEGDRHHIGADTDNVTMRLGVVPDPDSLIYYGKDGKKITRDVFDKLSVKERRDLLAEGKIDFSQAEKKKVSGKGVIKRSDYKTDEQFAVAVYNDHKEYAKKKMKGFDKLTAQQQATMISMSYNAGSLALGWSGNEAIVEELTKDKPDPKIILENAVKHAKTHTKNDIKYALKGLAKRRASEYNKYVESVKGAPKVTKVEQVTRKNGKVTFKYYGADGKILYTQNTNFLPDVESKDGSIKV